MKRKLKVAPIVQKSADVKTPLAEGLIKEPTERRDWKRFSDDQLIEYAKKFIKENGIKNREGLRKLDKGLYHVLTKRKLLDKIDFEEYLQQTPWASFSDEELVTQAKKLIEEKKIYNRHGLVKIDSKLYHILRKRKLLDKIEFEEQARSWSSFSDEELIEYAKKFIRENEIKNQKGLEKADTGLYQILRKRKLLDKIEFEEQARSWSSFSDEELIEYAKKFIRENEIRSRSDLEKAYMGLYSVLRRRKLLDKIEFEKEPRSWSSFLDLQLIEYARNFIEQKGIRNKKELVKMDSGLYHILRKRKLLDKIDFEKNLKYKSWTSFSDEELIAQAKKLIEKREIKNRAGLIKASKVLYLVLTRRKLLDAVFQEIEASRQTDAVRAVVKALDEF